MSTDNTTMDDWQFILKEKFTQKKKRRPIQYFDFLTATQERKVMLLFNHMQTGACDSSGWVLSLKPQPHPGHSKATFIIYKANREQERAKVPPTTNSYGKQHVKSHSAGLKGQIHFGDACIMNKAPMLMSYFLYKADLCLNKSLFHLEFYESGSAAHTCIWNQTSKAPP